MLKIPGIKSKLGSYASALYLLKESYEKEYNTSGDILLEQLIQYLDINNDTDALFENKFDSERIGGGVYVASHEMVTLSYNTINEGDVILIGNSKSPLDEFKNVSLYSAIHMKSGDEVVVSKSSVEKINEDISTAHETVAGMAVFDVDYVPHQMMSGHEHKERWGKDKFNSLSDDMKNTIRRYSYRNKNKTIALRSKDGTITTFKKGRTE